MNSKFNLELQNSPLIPTLNSEPGFANKNFSPLEMPFGEVQILLPIVARHVMFADADVIAMKSPTG